MIKKNIIIFFVFGAIYINIEVLFRALQHYEDFGNALIGYSSLWMFLIGGLSALLVGLINETFKIPLALECLLGGLIITLIELISGLVLNKWLGFYLWDYTDMPLNIAGQVSLLFSAFWIMLVPCIHFLDDLLRRELK
jgi:uncharacterized membrane protein